MTADNEIFISYAWRGESEATVDAICEVLRERFHTYQRDKEAMSYRDSIHEFMEKIGRGNFVIAVISDKYMKSEYCMFEAMRMMQAEEFEERVFPIVLGDADVYSTTGQLGYLKYWKETYTQIETDLKAIDDPALGADFALRLRDIKETTLYVGRWMSFLADRNLLSPEMLKDSGYAELIGLIEEKMGREVGIGKPRERGKQDKGSAGQGEAIPKAEADNSHDYANDTLARPQLSAAHPVSFYTREIEELRSWGQRKRLLLFVGPDIHPELSGAPTSQQLADGFASASGRPPGETLQQITEMTMHGGSRFGFTQFLKNQLTRLQPGPLFHMLAQFVRATQPEWILTTAFHRLFEVAMEEAGDYSLQIVTADNQLPFIERTAPALLKLFGDIQQAEMIVTEQDVSNLLRGRMNNRREMFDQMEQLLKQNCILFIGHDFKNRDTRSLVDLISGGQFQIRSYAIASGLDQDEIASFETNRGLKILDTDAFDVLKEISS
jgi:hypothetical protein